MEPPGTMFATLSLDEMLTIFAHYNFKEEYLLDFLNLTPFRRTAPHLFRIISFAGGYSALCANPDTQRIEMGTAAGTLLDISNLAACGQVFNVLEIDFYFYFHYHSRSRFSKEYLTQLERLFQSGSTLELSYSNINSATSPISQLISLHQVMGRRFEGLTIAATLNTRCEITRNVLHCVGQTWTRLKRFKYYGCDRGALSHLWECVGGTLEELEVAIIDTDADADSDESKCSDWIHLLVGVGTHCRRLHSVILDNPLYPHHQTRTSQEQYVAFLISYGAQLIETSLLEYITRDDNLCRVAYACHNLRVDMHEKMHRFGRISILGKRLRNLTLRLQHPDTYNYSGEIAAGMARATALERLDIYAETTGCCARVCDIFATRMGGLKHLMLDMTISADDLGLIGRKTGDLRRLDIRRMQGMVDSPCVRTIMDANARLEHVAIKEVPDTTYTAAETLAIVADVVSAVKQRGTAISISLASRNMPAGDEMHDTCVPLRIRHVACRFFFRDGKHAI